jgi:hypothetical protein
MVTPDWIRSCGKIGKIVPPTKFIRTLPTKSSEIEENGDASYGVARLAAILKSQPKKPALPFRDMCFFFCGSYKQDVKIKLSQLLRDGGGKVLSGPADVSSKLQAIAKSGASSSTTKFVVLCADSGISLPKSLERELKAALESDESPKLASVVRSQWLMESVTCARPMPAALFEPNSKKELWRLSLT